MLPPRQLPTKARLRLHSHAELLGQFFELHSHNAKAKLTNKQEARRGETLPTCLLPRAQPKPIFSLQWSYHRTGGECYYGYAMTCKRDSSFFLQFFYKVKSDLEPYGTRTRKRNVGLTGPRQS